MEHRQSAKADPQTGQTELSLPDPNALPEPELYFPDGPRDWIHWAESLDYSVLSRRRDVQDTARRIMLEIVGCAGHAREADGYGTAFPGIATLARRIAVSRRTVERAFARIEAAGWLQRASRRRENGGKASNLYTLKPGKVSHTPTTLQRQSVAYPCDSSTAKCRMIEHKKEHKNNPAHGRAYARGDSDSVQWLRKRGVRDVSVSKVAETDPALFRRVRDHVDRSNGKYGPGAVVKMLRGEMDVPEPATYTSRALPCGCAKGYCACPAEVTQ